MYLILLLLGNTILWVCKRLDSRLSPGASAHGFDLFVIFGWFLGAILVFIGGIGALHNLYIWLE